MNNATQKIRIDSLNASHTQEGTLHVWGKCTFQFYDRGSIQMAPLQFTSYGNCAVALNEAGVGAVVLGLGRLNMNVVEKADYKQKVVDFTITNAEIIRQGSTQTQPVQPVSPTPPQLTAIAGGNSNSTNGNGKGQVADLLDIPF
ncbi:hypothetical protein [Coleofasciculus sp.]|uniref:hypothetical protein n=1 Tax=Coleofasciculus sp. TaxID=3100458 RepID=UPI003A3521E3